MRTRLQPTCCSGKGGSVAARHWRHVGRVKLLPLAVAALAVAGTVVVALSSLSKASFWDAPLAFVSASTRPSTGGGSRNTALAAAGEPATLTETVPYDQLIRVRRLTNVSGKQESFYVQFDKNETVGDLKNVIEEETGLEVNFQDLKLDDPNGPQRTLFGELKLLKDIEPPIPNISAEVWLYDRRVPRRRKVIKVEADPEPLYEAILTINRILVIAVAALGIFVVGGQILEKALEITPDS